MQPIYQFFDNLGHCRFSAFSPSNYNDKKKKLIDMIGRFAIGVLALLSLYDLIENAFPFTIKIIIEGPLIAVLSSLGLSILLKSPQKKSVQPDIPKKIFEEPKQEIVKNIPKREENIPQRKYSVGEENESYKPLKPINLIDKFNACANE